MSLREALAAAYHAAVVGGNRATAIAALREAVSGARADAEEQLRRFNDVLSVRAVPGRSACFITETQRDLLAAALTPRPE